MYAFTSEYAMQCGFTSLSAPVASVEEARKRYSGYYLRVVEWDSLKGKTLYEGKA